MFSHYLAIAKASPVPIILYNVPSRTGVNLEVETVIRLAGASDKIVAQGSSRNHCTGYPHQQKYTRPFRTHLRR